MSNPIFTQEPERKRVSMWPPDPPHPDVEEDEDGFIAVKEYAALWKPKKFTTTDNGVIYIKPEPKRQYNIPPPGWFAFYVDSPQEFSAILDMLRNDKGIRFRPNTDYAIKTFWMPTNPKNK